MSQIAAFWAVLTYIGENGLREHSGVLVPFSDGFVSCWRSAGSVVNWRIEGQRQAAYAFHEPGTDIAAGLAALGAGKTFNLREDVGLLLDGLEELRLAILDAAAYAARAGL